MNRARHRVLWSVALRAWTSAVQAEYTETMDPNGLTKNLRSDFGLVDDDARADQSETFQRAIDALAAQGGGRLIVPKAAYRLTGVRLKSNIHLMIEAGTVVKPILTAKDERPGKWAEELRKRNAAHQ